MINSKIRATLLSGFFLLMASLSMLAQSDKDLLRQLLAEEQEAVNALVLYPKETRTTIFNATLHPEALIKMESIQFQTSTAFKTLMESYPQEDQKMIWDLTRYPDLVKRLANTSLYSESEVEAVLKDYPEVIHPRAKQAARNFHPLLIKINQLNQAAASAFDSILDEYSPPDRKTLQDLIALPEVLTILTENIRLTILVGDLYRKEPQWLHHKADSLNLVVARQNAEELEDWKESLKNNPQALEDLKASGASYNEEYGYSEEEEDEDYQKIVDDLYYEDPSDAPEEIVVHHYYNYHYPYWFGYPHWYPYPRWRIHPYWYDWGFYINRHNAVIFIGLPSYHFTHWYFHHPHHHTHWPHLSSHFVNHYYGHREVGSSVSSSVRSWRKQNEGVVTEKWLRNDGQLPSRFKEYGKFETERTKYNQKNPKKVVSQKEYIKKNKRRYPALSKSVKSYEQDKAFDKKPTSITPVKPGAKNPTTKKPGVINPKTNKAPDKKKSDVRKKPSAPKVNKANDYHKHTWEKSNKKRSTAKRPRVKIKTPKSRKKTRSIKKTKKPNRSN